MSQKTSAFRFDTFELRPGTRELYRAGIRIKLRPQPFQVLQVLLENAGQVVSREEFQKRLWPSDTFVDFEHGLNSSVRDLRAVLGDSAQEPRFIETLPKLGYRFIAHVIYEGESATPAQLASAPGISPGSSTSDPYASSAAIEPSAAPSLRWLAVAAICGAVLFAVGTAAYRSRRLHAASALSGRIMLAVLPFENRSGDATQE